MLSGFFLNSVGGGLLQGIQIDKFLHMKKYIVFILVAWIHYFVYISKGLVTRGYIHFVFMSSMNTAFHSIQKGSARVF